MRMRGPNPSLTNAALRAGYRTRVYLPYHLDDSSIETLDSVLPTVAHIAPRSLAHFAKPHHRLPRNLSITHPSHKQNPLKTGQHFAF